MTGEPPPAAPRRPTGRAALDRFDAEFLAGPPRPAEAEVEASTRSFAERALGAAPSPLDRIDRLFQQPARRTVWGVVALAALLVCGVVWTTVVERVVTVEAAAVIVPPDGLFSVGLPDAARIDHVEVGVGDHVSAGQPLAALTIADADEPLQLLSPIDGDVLVVGGREGEVVSAGVTLFVVVPAQEAAAVGLFPADTIGELATGGEAWVTINGVSPERYGRVRGRVVDVGDIPVSPARVVQLTGDQAFAAALSEQGLLYEVVVELTSDETPSGLRWSHGAGPEQPIPVGALAQVSVVVEREPLIRGVLG